MSRRSTVGYWLLGIASALLLAAVHHIVFHGWCGRFNGGPDPYQLGVCGEPGGRGGWRWTPLLGPAVILTGAVVMTMRGDPRWLQGALAGAVLILLLVPYAFIELGEWVSPS